MNKWKYWIEILKMKLLNRNIENENIEWKINIIEIKGSFFLEGCNFVLFGCNLALLFRLPLAAQSINELSELYQDLNVPNILAPIFYFPIDEFKNLVRLSFKYSVKKDSQAEVRDVEIYALKKGLTSAHCC